MKSGEERRGYSKKCKVALCWLAAYVAGLGGRLAAPGWLWSLQFLCVRWWVCVWAAARLVQHYAI